MAGRGFVEKGLLDEAMDVDYENDEAEDSTSVIRREKGVKTKNRSMMGENFCSCSQNK